MDQGRDDLLRDTAHTGFDETSTAWVRGLTCEGAERETAIEGLYALLLRIARAEAVRRAGLNGISGVELDDLAHQAAADACLSIVRKVGDFRGDSKFTTWAYKFVIYEVSSKFSRHAWRRDDIRLAKDSWDRLPGRLGTDPEDIAGSRELVAAVRRAVEEELTPHQRRIFVAIVLNDTPLDVLAAELGSNRNAIYKALFDARGKLRANLATHGYITTAHARNQPDRREKS